MQDVLKEILKVEETCGGEIRDAAKERERSISDLAQKLEQRRQEEKKKIVSELHARFSDATRRAREEASMELSLTRENLMRMYKNDELHAAVRERIASIVFGGKG